MLCPGDLAGLEGLLQLLQRRQYRRVGSAESDVGQAVPGSHGRRVLHRHLRRRIETVDRRSRQHRAFLGPTRGQAAAAARFHLADILPRLLPHRRVAGRRDGELERGGASRHQVRQVSAASARLLRALAAFRLLRQVVRLDRQRQSAERVAYAVRCFNISGKYPDLY